jgi:hypothetical protein
MSTNRKAPFADSGRPYNTDTRSQPPVAEPYLRKFTQNLRGGLRFSAPSEFWPPSPRGPRGFQLENSAADRALRRLDLINPEWPTARGVGQSDVTVSRLSRARISFPVLKAGIAFFAISTATPVLGLRP